MTKIDIINDIYENLYLSKEDSRELVENILEVIKVTLSEGESVKIAGFGTFNVRKKRERLGRNPRTGEEFNISSRTVVTFRPGYKLKQSIESLKK